ncbi:Seipin-1 [Bienertia sinuspersici]
MEVHDERVGNNNLGNMIVLTNWFPKLVDTQIDLITTTLTSILTTTFIPSQVVDDFKHPTTNHDHEHDNTSTLAFNDAHTRTQTQIQKLVRKVGYGLVGAVYVGMVLTMVMVLAAVVGVMMVNYFVEQPLLVKQKLYFDYTNVNPEAVLCLKLMAEVMSTDGRLVTRSSQPLMLQFHSYPIRLMRTFIMGIPILLGISRETQNIKVQMLRYKEDNIVRTDAVKITLMPRAWTPYLPQIYEAEIQLHSKLPRFKELVYNWKWTFYVWTSLYVYSILLILLLCFFRTLLVFPLILKASELHERGEVGPFEREEKPEVRVSEGREISETLRKWQQYRRKRKAALLSRSTFTETNVDSISASSYSITKDPDIDIFSTMEEDVGDSESVCKGG